MQYPRTRCNTRAAPLCSDRMSKPAAKNPARVVLQQFQAAGVSIRAIARELDIEPSTVSRWPERNLGAGDIPSRYHRGLLKLAAAHGALVTADTLVTGSW